MTDQTCVHPDQQNTGEAEKRWGDEITLPGIDRPVGVFEPIYFEPELSNFTWSEATKGGSRIPATEEISYRIVRLARYMDGVREFLGWNPIHVTSWYRDPRTNRRVGGARNSRHMHGDAVDFWVEGRTEVNTFNRLKEFHTDGGLAVGNGFVHIDLRGEPARWHYRGGPRVSLW